MLPQILAAQLNNTNNRKEENNLQIVYDESDIIMALVKSIDMSDLVLVKRSLLKRANHIENSFISRSSTLHIDLYEPSLNTDGVRHIVGIMNELGELDYDIHITVNSEFEPGLSELLTCKYISKITWDRSSYVSFTTLKKTAHKKELDQLSDFGKYFMPKVVKIIRKVFKLDLSDIDSFESIYTGDEILEILNDDIKSKSIILK